EKVRELYNGLYHNLEFIVGYQAANEYFEKGIVETVVLSNMRGSSFSSSFLVLDEASLLHVEGNIMKLFLTRIGKNSKVVILGDRRQSTLDPNDMDMLDAMNRLHDIDEIACVEMDDFVDVQRSEIVRKILQKYEG
ncbi:MAG TPA: PhoH family protein, partial [Alphaproteobacteria bacterium]|nr:PhoH family protein [Alphaproteobacteria bacterium]